MIRILIAGVLMLAATVHVSAFDNGQWKDVDPATRDWFKSLRNQRHIPCCDTADGHRTQWRADPKTGGYEVQIEDEWFPVPPEAMIDGDKRNPTGESIVWYGHVEGKPWIRCFLPGSAI